MASKMIYKGIRRYFGLPMLVVFLSALTGCAVLPDYSEQAGKLANAAGWRKQWLSTPHFDLLSYVPYVTRPKRQILTIYIEGDGRAWSSTYRISPDPTPRNPVGLKLALRHPSDQAVAYLARPCQYDGKAYRPPCRQEYWTGKRFAPKVIKASQAGVDQLKRQVGAEKIILVGYSGGGAVAALLAAERQDVAELITVAGNLDHKVSTEHHSVTPLRGSLNPADAWQALRDIPQRHFVGGDDRVIPPLVVRAYQRRFPEEQRPSVRIIDGFDHHCCWEKHWSGLLGP
uniref:Alpha/beta hydrolase family protein n=1 Tax=Candidatus Kentrum sp. TUN TaxID=2126343 RepID=A0A450ZJI8_9GAMM|nr:MAG: Alpha/beta hydrolase family protein [Candidatus Kentron sp. TUN]VFK55865.1 MAG: Alpha/beta hydrolase family protein [Candidatus Kentron sp. TUN]VFK62356.1 MAG: Alpha/beta hydrolase family protein [Candidatus Kentron sp. TUN]